MFNIDIYADGADLEEMKKAYEEKKVSGFTTNPSLMKKAGVKDYKKFAKEAVKAIPDFPLSFEVFSDDFGTMEEEAKILSSYGENIFVKIPITNSRGESSIPLIKKLSHEGVNLNITAIFTLDQVKKAIAALDENSKTIISVFAGRIADTGVNPENIMKEAKRICEQKKNTKLLWASCREVYNIIQADELGVDIITVQNAILNKLSNLGKDLEEYSLDTVKGFARDVQSLGFSIL